MIDRHICHSPALRVKVAGSEPPIERPPEDGQAGAEMSRKSATFRGASHHQAQMRDWERVISMQERGKVRWDHPKQGRSGNSKESRTCAPAPADARAKTPPCSAVHSGQTPMANPSRLRSQTNRGTRDVKHTGQSLAVQQCCSAAGSPADGGGRAGRIFPGSHIFAAWRPLLLLPQPSWAPALRDFTRPSTCSSVFQMLASTCALFLQNWFGSRWKKFLNLTATVASFSLQIRRHAGAIRARSIRSRTRPPRC